MRSLVFLIMLADFLGWPSKNGRSVVWSWKAIFQGHPFILAGIRSWVPKPTLYIKAHLLRKWSFFAPNKILLMGFVFWKRMKSLWGREEDIPSSQIFEDCSTAEQSTVKHFNFAELSLSSHSYERGAPRRTWCIDFQFPIFKQKARFNIIWSKFFYS